MSLRSGNKNLHKAESYILGESAAPILEKASISLFIAPKSFPQLGYIHFVLT